MKNKAVNLSSCVPLVAQNTMAVPYLDQDTSHFMMYFDKYQEGLFMSF